MKISCYCSANGIKYIMYVGALLEGENMEYLTTNEVAELWNISRRRVNVLCESGRIQGVVRKGKIWLIPKDSQKPCDARSTRYVNTDKIVLLSEEKEN